MFDPVIVNNDQLLDWDPGGAVSMLSSTHGSVTSRMRVLIPFCASSSSIAAPISLEPPVTTTISRSDSQTNVTVALLRARLDRYELSREQKAMNPRAPRPIASGCAMEIWFFEGRTLKSGLSISSIGIVQGLTVTQREARMDLILYVVSEGLTRHTMLVARLARWVARLA